MCFRWRSAIFCFDRRSLRLQIVKKSRSTQRPRRPQRSETGVFKTLPVADRIYRESELPESCAGYARDTITLGWEERQKAHGRRRSDGGVEFGTSLSRW